MNDIILENRNGKILVSSLDVAEKFGKRHDSILRDIDNLISDSTKVWSEMFIESSYKNERGKIYRCFDMNRDAFSLLCMGFNGKKALEWKLKYIDAFNKMEEKLKSGDYLSEEEKLKLQLFSKDPLEVTSAHNRLVELEVNKATAPLVAENNHKQKVINALTNDVPLYEKPDIINRICRKSQGGYAKARNKPLNTIYIPSNSPNTPSNHHPYISSPSIQKLKYEPNNGYRIHNIGQQIPSWTQNYSRQLLPIVTACLCVKHRYKICHRGVNRFLGFPLYIEYNI